MSSIYVTLGKRRYVGGTISETSGKDISGATFTIALGVDGTTPPANVAFVTPDVNTAGTTTASRILKLLISSTVGSGATQVTAPGTYYVWGNIADAPEIEPLVLQGPIIVV